jgi:hypothetical protein
MTQEFISQVLNAIAFLERLADRSPTPSSMNLLESDRISPNLIQIQHKPWQHILTR